MPMRFLFLDTPDHHLEDLIGAFQAAAKQKCKIDRLESADRLLERLADGPAWDLLVVDFHLGDGTVNGIDLLPAIRSERPVMPVAMVAEHGDVHIAARAIEAGANDFMVRSGRLADRAATLLNKIHPHLNLIKRNRILREQNMLLRESAWKNYRIVGESPQIAGVIEKIDKVANIPRPVLITGERGTGKELVARAIHSAMGDTSRPMLVLNCAAFPDNLLETELFGHEKGAFTGAANMSRGKFELAGNGTLFLDEIGNMSLSFQQKILRAVEYNTFTRVGGSAEIKVDTRVITATNVDLEKSMAEGRFLRDLYDRLSFETIHVPALREREGDIALLTRHFLHQFIREIPSLRGKHLSQAALDMLCAYSFPGNVRELKNIIERAAYRANTSEITPEDVGILPGEANGTGGTFYEQVEAFKEDLIKTALNAADGNQAKAARAVGLSYHQFRYYLQKYTNDRESSVEGTNGE